jgi:hypothetical protein
VSQPLRDITRWANNQANYEHIPDFEAGYQFAQVEIIDILAEYVNDPSWICLEGMTAGELQAYDYGCASAEAAVRNVLDGKDKGHGMANEPWQSLRKRLLGLVGLWRACGN